VKLGWFWFVFEGDRILANGLTEESAMERAAVA
jgi:hypothetical protein